MPRVAFTLKSITRRARKDDERGAILILGAFGLLLALVASALAVDLGRQASEKKSDQLVADLAALDSVRELEPILLSVPGVTVPAVIANATDAAKASAARNGFDPAAAGHSVTAEVGSVDGQNVFTPNTATVNAVRVIVGSSMDYIFAPGGKDLRATAVSRLASNQGPPCAGCGGNPGQAGCTNPCTGSALGGFDLGSALASADFDAVSAPVINRVFGQMIGGNADVLSWKGLGDANVSMAALSHELGALGLDVGTPQKLLAADMTLGQLFTATANALDQQGGSAAQAALFRGSAGIIAQSTNTTTFKLSKIMSFDQGNGATVADANMKVRNLVVAAAEAANGANIVSVPTAGVAVPNVSNTALTLQIVEPQKHIFGAIGATDHTAQVKLTVTPTIDDSALTIPLIPEPKITGAFPFTLQSAGATGTIANLDCVAAGMTVGVDTQPVTGAGSGSLRVTAKLPIVGTVPLVDVPTVATMPSIAAKHTDLNFDYVDEFFPTWSGSKRAGTTPINLAGVNYTVSGTPTVITPLPLGAQMVNVTNAVLTRVNNHLQVVETKIITPLVRSLGLTIGVADVTATDLRCLSGNPPTSTPPTPGTGPGPYTPPALSYRPVLVG
jgi:uncharacterized membrane protein